MTEIHLPEAPHFVFDSAHSLFSKAAPPIVKSYHVKKNFLLARFPIRAYCF